MMNYKKAKISSVPEQQVEIDKRSMTTADKAFNYIAKPEQVKVNGTNYPPLLSLLVALQSLQG